MITGKIDFAVSYRGQYVLRSVIPGNSSIFFAFRSDLRQLFSSEKSRKVDPVGLLCGLDE
jgi:hypothetical protein